MIFEHYMDTILLIGQSPQMSQKILYNPVAPMFFLFQREFLLFSLFLVFPFDVLKNVESYRLNSERNVRYLLLYLFFQHIW